MSKRKVKLLFIISCCCAIAALASCIGEHVYGITSSTFHFVMGAAGVGSCFLFAD